MFSYKRPSPASGTESETETESTRTKPILSIDKRIRRRTAQAASSHQVLKTTTYEKKVFTFNGFKAFRLAYDRFVVPAVNSKNKLELTIGKFQSMNDSEIDQTDQDPKIVLDADQALRLCSIMLNQFAKFRQYPKKETGDLSKQQYIGGDIFVHWSAYKGFSNFHVRQYEVSKEGQMKPTKVGATLGIAAFKTFEDLIRGEDFLDHLANAQRKGHQSKKAKMEEVDFHGVLRALPNLLYAIVGEKLQAACEECQSNETEFRVQVKSGKRHTCFWSTEKTQLTDALRVEAMLELRERKMLIGVFMHVRPWGEQTNFAKIMDFDGEGFLKEHEDEIWTAVEELIDEK